MQNLLSREYDLVGSLKPLPGERDQNVCVTIKGRAQFVLKIAGSSERRETIDTQIRALEEIRKRDATLGVPHVVPTLTGRLRTTILCDAGIEHHVRVLTYVPGVPLDMLDQRSEKTLRAVGVLMGRIVHALEHIAPPVTQDFLPWDVLNGLVVQDAFRQRNLPPELCEICNPFLDHFAAVSLPKLLSLPAQLIHNDLHAGNILCDPNDPTRLTGCIDFGDMVVRPSVMELASAFGEFAGAVPDTLECFKVMLQGFRTRADLPNDLLPLLFDASLARAILSAQLATFRVREANFDPAIETSHLPSAIRAVRSIAAVGRERFVAALSETS